jgi:transcriptional regulator with XRE-family HTH domain
MARAMTDEKGNTLMATSSRAKSPNRDESLDPKERARIDFSNRLQAVLLEKGLTQSDLAREADLGRDAISTYVRAISMPEPKNLHKIAKALKVPLSRLLPEELSRGMERAQPMLEIQQAPDHPDKVWIRVNQLVSMDLAGEIFNLLKKVDAVARKASAEASRG